MRSFDFKTIKRVLSLVRPHIKTLGLAMVFLLAASGIALLFPHIIREALNEHNIQYLIEHTNKVIGTLLLLIAIQGLCFYFRSYFFNIVGHRVVADIRQILYQKLITQDIAFFDSSKTGDLVSRLASDTTQLQNAVSYNISVIIRYTLQVLGGVILMFLISLKLTLIILCIVPLLVAFTFSLGKKLKAASKAMQAELGIANSIAEETLYGARIVKAYTQETQEVKRYSSSVKKALALAIERAKSAAFLASFSSTLLNAAIIAVLWYGVIILNQGQLQVGDLTGFMLYGMIVAISFAFLAGSIGEFAQALGSADRIFAIVDKPTETENNHNRIVTEINSSEIEFSSVSFCYPSRPEISVLKDVSFKIPAGTSLALVGPSGSGKSTIIQLLLSFYKPKSGKIYLSGNEITKINLQTLRDKIALVPQDPELFSMSIREVLLYGNPKATEEDLLNVCKQANIIDFINAQPDGLDTYVGDRGVQLSGGQKQRIAIARAMLKDPQILILDEATSSLDSENEALIQDALEKLMKGRTSIIIAHRLSTVKNVDNIIVLQDGKIVESGDHKALIEAEGLYKQLVEKQEL